MWFSMFDRCVIFRFGSLLNGDSFFMMLYIRVCCIVDSHDPIFVPCLYYHPSILDECFCYKRVMNTSCHLKGMVQVDEFEFGYRS